MDSDLLPWKLDLVVSVSHFLFDRICDFSVQNHLLFLVNLSLKK